MLVSWESVLVTCYVGQWMGQLTPFAEPRKKTKVTFHTPVLSWKQVRSKKQLYLDTVKFRKQPAFTLTCILAPSPAESHFFQEPQIFCLLCPFICYCGTSSSFFPWKYHMFLPLFLFPSSWAKLTSPTSHGPHSLQWLEQGVALRTVKTLEGLDYKKMFQ